MKARVNTIVIQRVHIRTVCALLFSVTEGKVGKY